MGCREYAYEVCGKSGQGASKAFCRGVQELVQVCGNDKWKVATNFSWHTSSADVQGDLGRINDDGGGGSAAVLVQRLAKYWTRLAKYWTVYSLEPISS